MNLWDPFGLVSKTHYHGGDGTWRVDSEVNGPGKGGGVHINTKSGKWQFLPNTQTWLNEDHPSAQLPKSVRCEMNTDAFKKKLGNAINRVNQEGGGFSRLGGATGKYLPMVAAIGFVIGMNESTNAMQRYTNAMAERNFAEAQSAALDAAQSLPGMSGQQADLLMRLQDAIEEGQSGEASGKCD